MTSSSANARQVVKTRKGGPSPDRPSLVVISVA
jgi:hypothetical protein